VTNEVHVEEAQGNTCALCNSQSAKLTTPRTCGSSLKGTSLRTCPEPGKIQEYLLKNTGFEGVIGNECKVCFACYKSHLQILKCVKTISTDSDLLALISALKLTLTPTKDISRPLTDTDNNIRW